MSIYKGNTKLAGTGQVVANIDDTLDSTSNRAVTNAAITGALEDVGYSTWQKPTDWIDIRQGALDNSVYFLVGHPSDYSKYRYFSVKATVSTSANTYDVYVDGVKQASTASGTATTLDFQTLALATGYDVTYPEALRTHIVRVSPSVSTDTISKINMEEISGNTIQGVLWVHVTASNAIDYMNFIGGWSDFKGRVVEAVTCAGESLLGTRFQDSFDYAVSLKYVPVLEGSGNSVSLSDAFRYASSIPTVRLKNIKNANGYAAFRSCLSLKKIISENSSLSLSIGTFGYCPLLENIPTISELSSAGINECFSNCAKLKEDFILDLSRTQVNGYPTRLVALGGSSSVPLTHIKGVILNPNIRYTGANSVDVSYTGMNRAALIVFFNSLPTVEGSQVCNVTGCTGAADLTTSDIAIATDKGWTVTR